MAETASRTSSEASAAVHSPGVDPADEIAERADRDFGDAERSVVYRRVTEHGDDVASFGERANLRGALLCEHLGSDVFDVERARDGLARLA